MFDTLQQFLHQATATVTQCTQLMSISDRRIRDLLGGPHGTDLLQISHTVDVFSRYGIIVLLFMVGLETNIDETRRVGGDSIRVALVIARIESDEKGVPILLKQYLKLGGRLLGFSVDPDFNDALDGLIMVDLCKTDIRTLHMRAMRRGLYWPQIHNNVIRAILGKAKHDTGVVYGPGNHDEPVREHAGEVFGNVDIQRTAVHETLDGKKLLVMHGDEFDGMLQCLRLMAWVGSLSYDLLLRLNGVYNAWRRRFNQPYWSLSSFIKSKVGNANRHIGMFESVVADYARKRGMDGVVCGHIHKPRLTYLAGFVYCNDGDWVEHCSALVERLDGTLSLFHWTDQGYCVADGDDVQVVDGGYQQAGTGLAPKVRASTD